MPKGVSCTFCALPDDVRRPLLVAWRDGASYGTLTKLARQLGQDIPQSIFQFCPVRSGHHGTREDAGGGQVTKDRLGRIADLLERSGIRPEDIGQVKSVRLSEWEGLSKNEDGDAVVTPLSGASIVLTPAWADGPQWPVVDRAAQVPVKLPPVAKKTRSKWKTAVILPDVQIGYRRDIDTAQLDPFHDEQAMAAALKVVQAADPDVVVHLGDFLDFASFGTYEQEPGFALTVQPAIDRAHRFLVETQAAAPRATQVLLEGNHDRRLQKAIVRNALAAFGIRRADAPDEWPVLSLPYLLRVEDLNCTYIPGYPAGIYWISDRLAVIHGHKVRSNGSTAAAVLQDDSVSLLFGHIHRIECSYRTRRVRTGAHTSLAASPGCLCRIDGAVPSTKGSTDPLGRPVPTVENWQHGCAVITYQPGDGPFALELVPIHDGTVIFRGVPL